MQSKQRFSVNWLARHLGVPRETLERLAVEAEVHYHPFSLPKPDGTFRLIDNPDEILKVVQRRIVALLLRPLKFHDRAHGCLPGRSPRTNAAQHLGQPCLVGLDLKHCFPSISNRHVYDAWHRLGYGPDLARLLTRLTTYQRYLPQGAPTSPYLVNLVLAPLDERMDAQALALSAGYGRFVDDVALSGERARELIGPTVREIGRLGFRINRRKTKVAGFGSQHVVTGYTVNRRGQPSIPRSRRDQVRSAIHELQWSRCNYQDRARLIERVRGRIAHIAQTNAGSAARLGRQLNRILEGDGPGTTSRTE